MNDVDVLLVGRKTDSADCRVSRSRIAVRCRESAGRADSKVTADLWCQSLLPIKDYSPSHGSHQTRQRNQHRCCSARGAA